MSDENIRYAYRICPCFSYDIEGIQTWLEDMASQGLVLEADGTFLGIFTFQKTTPKKYRYRLAPIKEQKGFFSDSLMSKVALSIHSKNTFRLIVIFVL